MAFTFFFRDAHVLDLIARHVVPSMAGFSRSRVWDAGCAMGPEAYSLAMVFAENLGTFGLRNLRIDASDIDDDGDFREIVTKGVYPKEVLDRLPEGLLAKHFDPAPEPGFFQIREEIRSRVVFHRHDLLSLNPVGSGYQLVVCKNVLLHFHPEERVAVVRMFHDALAPGGYFATEQTQKLPEGLEGLFEQVSPDWQLFRRS